MIRHSYVLAFFLALMCVGVASAQNTESLVVKDRVGATGERADQLSASEFGARVKVYDSAAANGNTKAINAWLQKQRVPHTYGHHILVVPRGRNYINDTIIVPPKTGIAIVGSGSGISYQLGNHSFGDDLWGGPESQLIWLGEVGKPMIRLQGLGTEIASLKLQGREIPTSDNSGTGHRATYGILVEGRTGSGGLEAQGAGPPTGKHHVHDNTFIELETVFYFPDDQVVAAHADSMRYENNSYQGNDKLLHVRNTQSISHHFQGTHEWVGPVNSRCFWFERGGHLIADNFLFYSRGTLLKIGGEGDFANEYSPNNNYFDIKFRWDNHGPKQNPVTLLDLSEAPDYPYCIRLSGLLAGQPGVDYDPEKLFIWPARSENLRRNIKCDISGLPAYLAANFPWGEPVSVTSAERGLIPKPYEGLHIYNSTTHKTQVYNGSKWVNLN